MMKGDAAQLKRTEGDNPFVLLVSDPLTGTTRTQRRSLLVSAGTSLVVLFTNKIPSKIDSLGIDELDQRQVLVIFLLVNLYFTLSFIAYSLADWWAWEVRVRENVTRTAGFSFEASLNLALRDYWGQFAGWRPLQLFSSRVLRRIQPHFQMKASPEEMGEYFFEYRERKRGLLSLMYRVTPFATLRFFVDILLPITMGSAAIVWLVWRV